MHEGFNNINFYVPESTIITIVFCPCVVPEVTKINRNESKCFDIPSRCHNAVFVWPLYMESDVSCWCRIRAGQIGAETLKNCVCFKNHPNLERKPEIRDDKICLDDIDGNLNGTVVVVGCFSQKFNCGNNSCLWNDLLSTNQIFVSGMLMTSTNTKVKLFSANVYCVFTISKSTLLERHVGMILRDTGHAQRYPNKTSFKIVSLMCDSHYYTYSLNLIRLPFGCCMMKCHFAQLGWGWANQ